MVTFVRSTQKRLWKMHFSMESSQPVAQKPAIIAKSK